MRKLLFIILLFLTSLGYAQKRYIPWLQAEDITNTRYFIWHGDTINFDDMQLTDSILISLTVDTLYIGPDTLFNSNFLLKKDSLLLFVTPKQLHDSLIAGIQHPRVSMGATALAGGLSIDSTLQVVSFQNVTNSRNGYLTSSDWVIFNSKLSVVYHDGTLKYNGTSASPLSVDTTLIATKWYASQGLIDTAVIATHTWVTNYVSNFKRDSLGTDWTGTFDGKEGSFYNNYDSLQNLPTIPEILDSPYPTGWDGDQTAGASRNAIYDAIASLGGGHAELSLSSGNENGLAFDTTQVQQILKLDTANASRTGALSMYDWAKFNAKQNAGSYITAEVDGSTSNELIDSVRFNSTTKILTIYEGTNTKSDTLTGLVATEVDGSVTNELQNLSKSKVGNNVTLTLTPAGNSSTFSVADGDSLNTNEIQKLTLLGTTTPIVTLRTGATINGDTILFKGTGGTTLTTTGDTIKINSGNTQYKQGTGITISGDTIYNASPDRTVTITSKSPSLTLPGSTYPNFFLKFTEKDSSITNEKNLEALYTPSTRIFGIRDSAGWVRDTLNLFTSALPGLVPASGGTTTFLRADGTWATPAGTTYTASSGVKLRTNIFSSNILGLTATTPTNGNQFFMWENSDSTKYKVDLLSLGNRRVWNANKIASYSVDTIAPSANQVLQFNATTSRWTPTSFSGGSLWTDTGDYTYLTSTTDNVYVGSPITSPFTPPRLNVYESTSGKIASIIRNNSSTGYGLFVSAGGTTYSSFRVADYSGTTQLLNVYGSGRLQFNQYGDGTFSSGTATKWLAVDADGYLMEMDAPSGGGTVTGSGVNERIALWSGASSLTSNANFTWNTLSPNGANLGIGIGTPQYNVHVGNNIKIGNAAWSTGADKLLYFGDNTYVYIGEKDADDRLYMRGSSLVIDIAGSKGTSGYVLTSNGTTATWAAPSGGGGTGDMLKSTYDNTGTTDIIDVENGGTGLSSLTSYAVLTGGTTSTGNYQQVSGLGTTGQVLTSQGAGALPVWGAAAGGWTDEGSTIRLTTTNDNVTIGQTTYIASKLEVYPGANQYGLTVQGVTGNYPAIYGFHNSSTGDAYGGYFSSNSSGGYGIYAHGDKYAGYFAGPVAGNSTFTGTNFILSSDKRLKANIKILRNTDWTDNLVYQSFTMKDDFTKRLRTGFIAQDVEKLAPNFVYTDEKGLKSLDYTGILISIVARQRDQIESLEERIEKLEKLINEK